MEEDDPRFKQALSCGDDPPPPYPSDESTQFPSPEPSDHRQYEACETVKRFNSTVYYQFQHQKCDAEEQLRKHPVRGPFDFNEVATATVIKRWTEQGIWNNKWDPQDLTSAYWKHEEPEELGSGSDSDSPSPPPIFGEKQERIKDNGRIRRSGEQTAQERTEREASRPCHQFNYQVLKEQERINTVTEAVPTKAYDNVKQRWINRGIWDDRWPRLPGMSWKHEEPRRHKTLDTPRHARVESSIPRDSTSLAPALHAKIPQAFRHSSTQNRRPSNRKLFRNGKRSGKETPPLTRVSAASKTIKKQNSRTGRQAGVIQQPLRRSARIADKKRNGNISIETAAPVKAVKRAVPLKSKRRRDSPLARMGAKPRGIAKRKSA
ncbi:MAG: hypothetical protein Q9188_007202 [Gyalolechia gomerana]